MAISQPQAISGLRSHDRSLFLARRLHL